MLGGERVRDASVWTPIWPSTSTSPCWRRAHVTQPLQSFSSSSSCCNVVLRQLRREFLQNVARRSGGIDSAAPLLAPAKPIKRPPAQLRPLGSTCSRPDRWRRRLRDLISPLARVSARDCICRRAHLAGSAAAAAAGSWRAVVCCTTAARPPARSSLRQVAARAPPLSPVVVRAPANQPASLVATKTTSRQHLHASGRINPSERGARGRAESGEMSPAHRSAAPAA